MPEYRHLTRDELLNLAQEKEQRTDEARRALDAEIRARQMEAAEVSSYARESLANRSSGAANSADKISYETRNRKFLEKRNRKLDPRRRVDEFDVTAA